MIALIRASENRDVAQKGLMANFGLDQIQANAILEMRLERLTRLEDKIVEERQRLLKRSVSAGGSVVGAYGDGHRQEGTRRCP